MEFELTETKITGDPCLVIANLEEKIDRSKELRALDKAQLLSVMFSLGMERDANDYLREIVDDQQAEIMALEEEIDEVRDACADDIRENF